jgi:uncharacterized protein (DUF952 family)
MNEQNLADDLRLPIYHLTPTGYYHRYPFDIPYISETFAQEGFVHCTSGVEMLVKVANHYFAHLTEPLLVLEIDPTCLTAPLKFEPPLPPPNHELASYPPTHKSQVLFPHIYGPINREAIVNCFPLQRDETTGQWIFQMPS